MKAAKHFLPLRANVYPRVYKRTRGLADVEYRGINASATIGTTEVEYPIARSMEVNFDMKWGMKVLLPD